LLLAAEHVFKEFSIIALRLNFLLAISKLHAIRLEFVLSNKNC